MCFSLDGCQTELEASLACVVSGLLIPALKPFKCPFLEFRVWGLEEEALLLHWDGGNQTNSLWSS